MAQDVGPEHLVEGRAEVVGVDVGNALVEIEDSDAVDQRVEPAEVLTAWATARSLASRVVASPSTTGTSDSSLS